MIPIKGVFDLFIGMHKRQEHTQEVVVFTP